MAHDHRFSHDSIEDGIRDRGSLILALLAGLVAAIISAGLWVEFTSLTGQNTGYLAAAVAGLVGLAVRILGGGSSWIFGLIGTVFTLIGTLAGQSGAAIMMSTNNNFDFYGVMTHINVLQMAASIIRKGDFLTYVIYAVALIGAFRISMHRGRKAG